tara:strand:+ start:604 stop:840 length:237 start_codon:yes stop_codon:yes gene_type:complete
MKIRNKAALFASLEVNGSLVNNNARLKTALRLVKETDVQHEPVVYEKQNPTSRIVLASRLDHFQRTLIDYNGMMNFNN